MSPRFRGRGRPKWPPIPGQVQVLSEADLLTGEKAETVPVE
jgi:hypothetical protein